MHDAINIDSQMRLLNQQRARISIDLGWNNHRLSMIIYFADGRNPETFTFKFLDTAQQVMICKESLPAVYINGVLEDGTAVKQAFPEVANLSSSISRLNNRER